MRLKSPSLKKTPISSISTQHTALACHKGFPLDRKMDVLIPIRTLKEPKTGSTLPDRRFTGSFGQIRRYMGPNDRNGSPPSIPSPRNARASLAYYDLPKWVPSNVISY